MPPEKTEKNKLEVLLDDIRKRRWHKVSFLVFAAWIIPVGGLIWSASDKVHQFLGVTLPQALWVWASISALLLIWTLWTNLRKRPDDSKDGALPAYGSAIRGLTFFEEANAEVFRRLGRQRDVANLVQAITSSNFRIGYLVGESGAGKSSLLHAGVLPALKSSGYDCHIVEMTNADPISSIVTGLTGQPPVTGTDFAESLRGLLSAKPKPVILILDQFEQWFVHRQRDADREPFLTALKSWYAAEPPVNLKILISIREDFAGKLTEIQQSLGYQLSARTNQPLRRFTIREAAAVLEAMCDEERVPFNRGFVEDQLERELADRDDGRISPVDLQILAIVVVNDPSGRESGFTAGDFRRFGGVEGLLDRYVRQQLASLAHGNQGNELRKAAIAVLRVLSSLDGMTGLGVLSEEQIADKLKASHSRSQVDEAVGWLARSDVRLIVPREGGFRLVHDRLVGALRMLVSESLGDAEKANQLLNRRAGEYLANNRASRFLLPFGEWRILDRQRPFIEWGTQETEKRELLERSKARTKWSVAAVAGVLLVGAICWGWWESPLGLRWRIVQEMKELANKSSDPTRMAGSAVALAQAGEKTKARALFKQAEDTVARITDPDDKSFALGQIAVALAHAGDTSKAKAHFKQAEDTVARMTDPVKSSALSQIAVSLAQLGEKTKDPALFKQAEDTVARITNPHVKSSALSQIAVSLAQLGEKTKDPALFKQAEDTVARITDPAYKSFALSQIAVALAHAGDTSKATALFKQVEDTVARMTVPNAKSFALRELAVALAQTEDLRNARRIAWKQGSQSDTEKTLAAILSGKAKTEPEEK